MISGKEVNKNGIYNSKNHLFLVFPQSIHSITKDTIELKYNMTE